MGVGEFTEPLGKNPRVFKLHFPIDAQSACLGQHPSALRSACQLRLSTEKRSD